MSQVPRSPSPRLAVPRRAGGLWRAPLVAGLCFGIAYGITQRLVAFNVGELIRFGQRFDVQVFPGTSLDSLRLRFGAADAELRGGGELPQQERPNRSVPADAEGAPQADGGEPPTEPAPPAAAERTDADPGAEPESGPPPAAPSGPPPAPLVPTGPVAAPARP